MNAPRKHVTTDDLLAISERLNEYVTCLNFTQWLIDNKMLLAAANPHALAYGFAVQYSNEKAELDTILLRLQEDQPDKRRQR